MYIVGLQKRIKKKKKKNPTGSRQKYTAYPQRNDCQAISLAYRQLALQYQHAGPASQAGAIICL